MTTPPPAGTALSLPTQVKMANEIIVLAEILSRDAAGALARITALDIIALAEALKD